MTKALLSNINSVWGTIINPQSSNTYRHIMSFHDELVKKQFIDKELFGGNDHIVLLEQQPEISLTQTSGNLATFRVNPSDYNNETIDSLLNKDFAIIKEDSLTRYYTLIGTRIGTQIEYIADLDIFFTHDIKNMFNDKQTRISRAMSDRYKIDGKTLSPIYKNDKTHENIIYNTEPIDSNIKESLIPSEKYPLSNNDVWDDFIDPSLSSLIKTKIKEKLNNDLIPFLATQVDADRESKLLNKSSNLEQFEDTFSVESKNGIKTEQPYSILLANNSIINICIQDDLKTPFEPFYKESQDDGFNIIEKWNIEELSDASIVKTSYSLSPHNIYETLAKHILNKHPSDLLTCMGITSLLDGSGEILHININLNLLNLNKVGDPITFKRSLKKGITQYPYRGILQRIDLNLIPEQFIVYDIFNDVPIDNIHIDNLVLNHPFEVKSLVAPYTKYVIKSSSKFSLDIYPQFFTSNSITGKYGFGFLTEQWTQWISLNNYYNNIYVSTTGELSLPMELDYYYEDINNYSFATDINAWEEFITSNKAQQNASFLNKGISAVVGTAGAVSSGGVSALALGSIALKSAGDLNSQFAQRKDIRNTPNKLVNAGSILLQDLVNKDLKPALYKYELNTLDKKLINEFFYKYGYNYNNKLHDINSLLKSRYFFNYIEIPESFEQIILQSSAEIKQVINDTLANGVTIWHLRDIDTFKGIKNYDYENVEMSIITAQNRFK